MSDQLADLIARTPPELLADIIESLPPEMAQLLLEDPAIAPEAARKDRGFIELARDLVPGFRARPHIRYMAERIEQAVQDVENGKSRYLVVEMPPRAGKTTTTTQITPAWILHKHPDWKTALISYDASLAASWGRQIRRWVEQGLLGNHVEVAKDAGAVHSWQTTEGADVLSLSTGMMFTGRGAKVLIIDDPHKDFADAHSETMRNGVWEWWKSVAYNRLEPPVLVIIVQTRWHEDDLIGRILSPDHDGDPENWEVIRLPAIAEENDPLGRKPGDPLLSPLMDETIEEAKARWAEVEPTVGAYIWAAMYQQRPAPPKGRMIQRDWLQTYNAAPTKFDEIIQSWDLAFSESATSSYVVGQVWGRIGAEKYLLDQWRDRTDIVGTLAAIEEMSAKWPEAQLKLIERKANGPAVLSLLRRSISGLLPVDPAGSKIERLISVLPQLEAKNIYIPAPSIAPWISDFIQEIVTFPGSVHDDQIDAMTQALQRMAQPMKLPRAKVRAY